MTFLEAQSVLNSFIDLEKSLNHRDPSEFKLDRIKHLLQLLDNPHQHLKIIHVAGSKGKGSTCAMTAHILKEAGYKVGLYTSPHLYHFRERIRLLDRTIQSSEGSDVFLDCISEQQFAEVLTEMLPAIESVRLKFELGSLTFYEVITALALYHFSKQMADIVILETGLGGRFDATNVVSAMVCAITAIGLEHTKLLGGTVEAISREKIAIVKTGKERVVVQKQDHAINEAINQHCKKLAIDPFWVEEECMDYEIPLLGKHQRRNLAVAVAIVEEVKSLGYNISTEAIKRGAQGVFWPGRIEVIQKNPLWIIDGAHTLDSVKELVETMKELFPDQKALLVVGMSDDKNFKELLEELKPIVQKLIMTKSNHPRARLFDEQQLNGIFEDIPITYINSVKEVTEYLATQNDVALFTGSIFMIAEVRKLCTNIKV